MVINLRILDSSVLVAVHAPKDVLHAQATKLVGDIQSDEKFVLNDYLVNEIATVMLRKEGLSSAKKVLDTLLNSEQITIQHTSAEEFQAIIRRFQAQTGSLNFVDCSILCLSDSMGCEVVTFDKPLAAELNKSRKAKRPGA